MQQDGGAHEYAYLARFAERSAKVRWSPDELAGAVVPDAYVPAFVAAALVEGETRREVVKARRAGLMRQADLRCFFELWIVEEDEHARALSFLVRSHGIDELEQVTPELSLRERLRSGVSPFGLYLSRLMPAWVVAFLGAGVAAEFVTRTLYRRLAIGVAHDGLKRFLFRVAAQESRHMSFFLAAAQARPSPGAPQRALIREMLVRGWNPVGMDRLGADAWLSTFRPVLEDDRALAELRGMDHTLDAIPLFSGLQLMDSFLTGVGYPQRAAEPNVPVTVR